MLAIDFSRNVIEVVLRRRGKALLRGAWRPQVRVAGHVATPAADWNVERWISEKRVDYLQIQQPLSGKLLLRQVWLFSREDEFLFAATEVHANDSVPLECSLRLPLAKGIVCNGEQRTTEVFLARDACRLAAVLPLALGEWKSGPGSGGWIMEGGVAIIQAEQVGASLYLPLFLDLRPRRFGKQLTWRRLTVGESRRPVTADTAVGYRVQSGKRQWVFYRALARAGNRTLLGINTSKEFVAARFMKSGKYKTLLELG